MVYLLANWERAGGWPHTHSKGDVQIQRWGLTVLSLYVEGDGKYSFKMPVLMSHAWTRIDVCYEASNSLSSGLLLMQSCLEFPAPEQPECQTNLIPPQGSFIL